ncbi:hypothetical protein HUN58_18585 [Curtobacterium sp. Csp1]|uniref:hypothetical protein n=1 Tax=Curtobacterium sp. Csp1 TaxID=2495429 RepID=UPI0015982D3D|nr:hypothetical protein [Curtobacterium sp. Csp1]QKS21659.1 hypothetical protein HUN58_18585 [Curtobacterium sp. Csp1]
MSAGRAFAAAYVGTIVVVLALVLWFSAAIRGRAAFARGRRWITYVAAWGLTYGLVLVVSLACAAWESRG